MTPTKTVSVHSRANRGVYLDVSWQANGCVSSYPAVPDKMGTGLEVDDKYRYEQTHGSVE